MRVLAFLYAILLLVFVLPIAIIVWAVWAVAQFVLIISTRDRKWTDGRSFQPAYGLYRWLNHNLTYAFFGVQKTPNTKLMLIPDLRG